MKGEKKNMTEQKMKQINAWISKIDKNNRSAWENVMHGLTVLARVIHKAYEEISEERLMKFYGKSYLQGQKPGICHTAADIHI